MGRRFRDCQLERVRRRTMSPDEWPSDDLIGHLCEYRWARIALRSGIRKYVAWWVKVWFAIKPSFEEAKRVVGLKRTFLKPRKPRTPVPFPSTQKKWPVSVDIQPADWRLNVWQVCRTHLRSDIGFCWPLMSSRVTVIGNSVCYWPSLSSLSSHWIHSLVAFVELCFFLFFVYCDVCLSFLYSTFLARLMQTFRARGFIVLQKYFCRLSP